MKATGSYVYIVRGLDFINPFLNAVTGSQTQTVYDVASQASGGSKGANPTMPPPPSSQTVWP